MQEAKDKVSKLEKDYSSAISGDESPKSEYDIYKEHWNAAKGDPKEQARLTALARQHKVVK